MQEAEPDYTAHDLAALLDVARHIDREKFPQRAARLDREIALRRQQGEPGVSGASADRSGCGQYAVAFGSFVPLLGLLAFLVAIALAFVGSRARRGATLAIAVSGLAVNVLLFGWLFLNLVHPIGTARVQRDALTRQQLTQLVREIEYFKTQAGRYPASLEELKTRVSTASIYDSSRLSLQLPQFYYRLNDHGITYTLRSVGADGRPFTEDDLLPDLSPAEAARTGFRDRRAAN